MLLGLALGWLTFRLMRLIDDYSLEVLITLGLAFGGYELAVALHVSGPIMAVTAGLLIGDVGAKHGMSEETRKYIDAFWRLIDEILNAVLFLLIGFEVFIVPFNGDTVIAGLLAIVLALVAMARRRGDPGRDPETVPRFLARCDPDHDLGRFEGRHFGRARPVVARQRMEAHDPRRDLYRRRVLDHRAGVVDQEGRDQAGPRTGTGVIA